MVVEDSPTMFKENSKDDLNPEIFFSKKETAIILYKIMTLWS